MSELAEKFLAIKTYEEFDKRREEFKELRPNEPGVLEHLDKLIGPVENGYKDGVIYEAF